MCRNCIELQCDGTKLEELLISMAIFSNRACFSPGWIRFRKEYAPTRLLIFAYQSCKFARLTSTQRPKTNIAVLVLDYSMVVL
jgi:hypothetical protein